MLCLFYNTFCIWPSQQIDENKKLKYCSTGEALLVPLPDEVCKPRLLQPRKMMFLPPHFTQYIVGINFVFSKVLKWFFVSGKQNHTLYLILLWLFCSIAFMLSSETWLDSVLAAWPHRFRALAIGSLVQGILRPGSRHGASILWLWTIKLQRKVLICMIH